MSKNHLQKTLTAALVFALSASTEGYPEGCNVHIFPDGLFRSDDGRPASLTGGEVLDWKMNAEIASGLISALSTSGKPILYDYEHNSRYGDSRAAGWIDKLVYVEGKGLYGHVEWTPDAADAIAKKVYRYSSPYFVFDASGAVKKLLSVALTNNPALGDLGAVGLRKHSIFTTDVTDKEAEMPGTNDVAALTTERDVLKSNVATLTAERDGLKTQVTALTTECDGLKAKVAAADKEKAEAALTAEQKKKDELIAAACSGDKPLMTPAQAEAVKGLPLADLTKFIDTLKPVPLTQRQADGDDKGGGQGLNADQLAWCNKMGVTPEQYVAAQKSQG